MGLGIYWVFYTFTKGNEEDWLRYQVEAVNKEEALRLAEARFTNLKEEYKDWSFERLVFQGAIFQNKNDVMCIHFNKSHNIVVYDEFLTCVNQQWTFSKIQSCR